MAIRPIGSSLIARQPGTITRKREEQAVQKPPIPQKGEVGTVQRDLQQETDIQKIPGSNKVVRVAPSENVTSQNLPGMNNPNANANVLPGVMGQSLPASAAKAPSSGTPTPAMFSNVSPNAPVSAGATGKGGVAPKAVSSTSANMAPIGGGTLPGGETSYTNPSGNDIVGSWFPGVLSLGSRIKAESPNPQGQVIPKNFAQAVVATLSKPGSKGEAWATNPNITNSGIGSLSHPSATINAIKPTVQNVIRSVSQAANNTANQLRSALSKLKFW